MHIIVLMCIRILMAWSFFLPVSGNVLNCGQYGLIAIGAYTAALLSLGNWPFIASIVLGGLMATVFSLCLGVLGLRLKSLGVVIVSIAYAEVIKVILNNSDKFLPAAGGVQGLFVHSRTNIWHAVITVLLIFVLLFRMYHSRIGRAIKAIGSDEQAAESLGVDKTAIKLFLMGSSGFLCGIAGGLFAHFTGYIEPEMFGFALLVEACAYALVGGLGTVWGGVVGVLAVDMFLESTKFLLGWRVFTYGAVIVFVLLFKPNGIVTEKGLQILRGMMYEKLRKVFPALGREEIE